MVYGSENFIMPHNFVLGLNGYYISKFQSGYSTFQPQSSINIGITKSLLAKQLILSFNIADIFYGSIVNEDASFNNISIHSIGHQESRVVNFGLSYHFGEKNSREIKNPKSINQETQRIKSEY
jgi:hypothetical protein